MGVQIPGTAETSKLKIPGTKNQKAGWREGSVVNDTPWAWVQFPVPTPVPELWCPLLASAYMLANMHNRLTEREKTTE